MNLFAVLESISPWWWVAFALVLGALEMLSMAFFLIGPALAALIMSVLLVLIPTMPGTVQVAMFAAISVALTFAFQALRHRIQNEQPEHGLNDRSARMVGRTGTIISFSHGHGTVEIDGVHWQAKADPAAIGMKAGAAVEVSATQGSTLQVVRLMPEEQASA
ncbi:NfeD family protein [Algicella marina]|uniref:NfeD-like C-terminal domain-containing protein n=1 Tax=Algicella marina TaxID=2683284 RepID=A0A6P1SZS5_9RHOB|nr:NfeD family protein [Algicella marina]QHQ33742.1 hypothetical protein GO499_00380 [Algicella marina]